MIGILTSSIEATADERGVSFFSSLIEALASQLAPSWPPTYWPGEGRCLFEVMDIHEGWRLRKSPNGTRWKYQVNGDVFDPTMDDWTNEENPGRAF